MNKQQLEQLSDFDINKAIANHLGVYHGEHESTCYASVKHNGENVTSVVGVVDYCNNWSDMGPLMEKSRFGMFASKSEYTVINPLSKNEDSNMCTHERPLRAAAIVYLLMQEGV